MVNGWVPSVNDGEHVEDLPLNEWVGQALGSASMCWADVAAAGEFDSGRCAQILEALMTHINTVIDGVIRGTARAVREPPVLAVGDVRRLRSRACARPGCWQVAMYESGALQFAGPATPDEDADRAAVQALLARGWVERGGDLLCPEHAD